MRLFSESLRHFCQSVCASIYLADPDQLGPFMLEAFKALPESGTARQQMQALGRWLMQKNMVSLMQDTPELLTPLATLFRDPEGVDIEQRPRTKSICCNSSIAFQIGVGLIEAALKFQPETTGRLLLRVFQGMGEDPKFNLFKPLGHKLVRQFESRITDSDALQDAWMLVKTNREGPLKLPPARDKSVAVMAQELLKDPDFTIVTHAPVDLLNEKAAAKMIDEDQEFAEFLRNLEEDPDVNARALHGVDIEKPIKVGSLVNIKHSAPTENVNESFATYEHILKNEPAFIGKYQHPKHGLLLVMISIDGRNDDQDFVHRGCAVFNPVTGSLDSHAQITSTIGPFRHTDESGAKLVVKAIPWRRGLCGRYWTNVMKGPDSRHNDVEELKRWFLLTVDEKKMPFLQIWSGAQGEANFNRYMNRMRRRLKEIRNNKPVATV